MNSQVKDLVSFIMAHIIAHGTCTIDHERVHWEATAMLIQQFPVPIKEAEDMPCGRGWAPPDLRTCPIAPAIPPLTKSAVRPEVEHRVGFRADSEPKFEAQAEAAPRGARQSGWPALHDRCRCGGEGEGPGAAALPVLHVGGDRGAEGEGGVGQLGTAHESEHPRGISEWHGCAMMYSQATEQDNISHVAHRSKHLR